MSTPVSRFPTKLGKGIKEQLSRNEIVISSASVALPASFARNYVRLGKRKKNGKKLGRKGCGKKFLADLSRQRCLPGGTEFTRHIDWRCAGLLLAIRRIRVILDVSLMSRATFTGVTRVNHSHRGHERSREADLDNCVHDPVRPIFTEAGEWIRHDAHTMPLFPSLILSLRSPLSSLSPFRSFPSRHLRLSFPRSITLFPLRNDQDSRKRAEAVPLTLALAPVPVDCQVSFAIYASTNHVCIILAAVSDATDLV